MASKRSITLLLVASAAVLGAAWSGGVTLPAEPHRPGPETSVGEQGESSGESEALFRLKSRVQRREARRKLEWEATQDAFPVEEPWVEGSIGPHPDEAVEATDEDRAALESAPVQSSTPAQRALAKVERDSIVRRLEESGAGGANWQRLLPDVRVGWEEAASEEGVDGLQVSDLKCFKEGCYLTSTTRSEEDASRLVRRLLGSPTLAAWQGELFASGVVMTDAGEVETTWAFIGGEVPTFEQAAPVPTEG